MTMPMTEEKKAFLIAVLGPERTAALLEHLPRAEKMLEEMGVAFKDDGAMDGRPLGGAVSFAQADAFQKASETAERTLDLVDVFRIVTSNVLADEELEAADKPPLLKAAATEFGKRLGGLGKKELEELTPRVAAVARGAAPYIADLFAGQGGASPATLTAVKSLRESGSPAADLTAALIEGGAIQG